MSYTPQTPYVTVQFENRYEPGVYAGRTYSYIADHRLTVGDVVPVETKFGDTVAKVVEVDVPEYRIKAVLPMLKHITAEPKLKDAISNCVFIQHSTGIQAVPVITSP